MDYGYGQHGSKRYQGWIYSIEPCGAGFAVEFIRDGASRRREPGSSLFFARRSDAARWLQSAIRGLR